MLNILLSVIDTHTDLFWGKGWCPLSSFHVVCFAVDNMAFATSPVNLIFIEYSDIVLKIQSFCVCSMANHVGDDNINL